MELNAIIPWLIRPRNLSPTLWSVVAVEGPSVDASDRLGRDATLRDTIPDRKAHLVGGLDIRLQR